MSKEKKSIDSIKATLDDKDYSLFAFIAISNDGCKQICTGAEDRGDLVKIVGELQLFICDIYDRLNQSEKMDKIQELLVAVRESTDEGEEDVRVLN
jgi:hypothetical protein